MKQLALPARLPSQFSPMTPPFLPMLALGLLFSATALAAPGRPVGPRPDQPAWQAAAANTPPALTPEQQRQRQQLRTQTHALLQEVEKLAQQCDADITRLAQQVQPQKEQWRADIQTIAAQHSTPADARIRPRRHRIERFFRPATFLLLEPPPAAASQVYPNPARNSTQLTYEVPKAGAVIVELLDGRGNALRTVAQANKQEKGPHTLSVDVADLSAGTYFFKINTRTGAETRRFVKE
jgi:Secretion system C-terminal sorting domain